MNDPMSSGNPLNFISQATEILAAHGVYALTAIFIFLPATPRLRGTQQSHNA